MFCYCSAQRGVYNHLLTPLLPLGSAVTSSDRTFVYHFCLSINAPRAQRRCSHRSQLPQLAVTMSAHPPLPRSPLCTTLPSHTQLRVPSPLHSSKALSCCVVTWLRECRGACATMEGCHLPCKDTIQQKNHRAGNRVCLSNPSLSCRLYIKGHLPPGSPPGHLLLSPAQEWKCKMTNPCPVVSSLEY